MANINENKPMKPEESFNSCLKYFRENEELFSLKQVDFLNSVLSYGDHITDKQKAALIKIVSEVRNEEDRYRKAYMKAINQK